MTSKFSWITNRRSASIRARSLRLEHLEPRQPLDAEGALALSTQSIDPKPQTSLQAATQKLVEYYIQLTDMQGNQIDSVRVDEDAWIKVYVRDLRNLPPNSLHLFSAYAQLSLDNKLFVATGKGRIGFAFWEDNGHSENYELQNPSLERSLNRQIGGIVIERYPGGSGHLLYQVPVRAVAEGEARIATKPVQDDSSNRYPTTLYNTNDPIHADSIQFNSLPITILPKVNPTPSISVPTALPTAPNVPTPNPIPVVVVQPPSTKPASVAEVAAQVIDSPPSGSQLRTQLPTLLPAPKISVEPRPTVTQAAAESAQLQTSPETQGGTKVRDLPTNGADAIHAEAILNFLAEWVVSRSNIVDEIHRFSAFPVLSALSHLSIHARGPELFQSLHDNQQLPALSQIDTQLDSQLETLSHRDNRHQPWAAREVIDRMLERIESGSSVASQSLGFEWEAIYLRFPMRRLPLHVPQSWYPQDDFIDANQVLEDYHGAHVTEGLLNNGLHRDLGGSYGRSLMKALPLREQGSALTVSEEIASELVKHAELEPEFSSVEGAASDRSSVASGVGRAGWTSGLLMGLVTVYLILRNKSQTVFAYPLRMEKEKL